MIDLDVHGASQVFSKPSATVRASDLNKSTAAVVCFSNTTMLDTKTMSAARH